MDTEVDFNEHINYIVGKNAQGKTNLLESIYLCAISKSPRTAKEKQMINFDSQYAQVLLNFNTIGGNKNIEIVLNSSNKKIIKVNKVPIIKLSNAHIFLFAIIQDDMVNISHTKILNIWKQAVRSFSSMYTFQKKMARHQRLMC